jgi:hypothetical protein
LFVSLVEFAALTKFAFNIIMRLKENKIAKINVRLILPPPCQ